MLISTLFPEKEKKAVSTTALQFKGYKVFLEKSLEKRRLVILLAVIIMAVSALLIPRLGSEFMPRSESPEFTVGLTLPEGTSLERTNSTAVNADGIIKDLLGEKLKMIYIQSGEDNTSSLSQTSNVKGENTASLKVILMDDFASEAENIISLVESYLITIPDLEVTFTREETALQTSLGTTESPFALEISGEDYSELERILKESKAILEQNPSVNLLFNG
jgi:HAE1 family hydrophobic/amphiphilic exporter-1